MCHMHSLTQLSDSSLSLSLSRSNAALSEYEITCFSARPLSVCNMQNLGGKDFREHEVGDLYKLFDRDNSKTIDFEEFCLLIGKKMREKTAPMSPLGKRRLDLPEDSESIQKRIKATSACSRQRDAVKYQSRFQIGIFSSSSFYI